MKTEITRLLAAILGVVACAAAQDVSPTMLGVKPPFLLAFGCFAGVPAAVIAGLFADALSGMPFGCSAAFFAAAALVVRFALRGWPAKVAAAVAVAGAYQLWISLWYGSHATSRSFAGALLAAAVVAPALYAAMRIARRWIGIDFDRRRA